MYSVEPIVLNEEAFTDAFIPTKLLNRENQIREIRKRLRPALKNRFIENIFLVGSSGTGKTVVVKWILENYFKEISVYVDCWKHCTTHGVLVEILRNLQKPVHGREPTCELVRKLERLVKSKKIIVCLDEVEKLKNFDLLYILARANCGLILISTFYHVLSNLASRIRNSLALTEIEFPTYSEDELYAIIRDRIQFAFQPGTPKTELIRIASAAAKGDAKVGLEIIRKAGKKAEVRGSNEISMNELKETISEANGLQTLCPIDRLNAHQKLIYEIIKKNRKMLSSSLYREYRALAGNPVADRTYRNYTIKMVNLRLMKSEGKGRWRRYEHVG